MPSFFSFISRKWQYYPLRFHRQSTILGMESLLYFIVITLFVSISSEASLYKHKYNAIFNFGDSISDTGNSFIAADSPDLSYLRKLPYGQTFFGRPTGRCSDGRLVVDFLTEAFGLPYLPPYLAHTHPGAGVNFAVAGATALDSDVFRRRRVWTNDSLTVQLGWFKEVKKSLCHTEQDCGSYIKKSLFLVGEIGWNDYNLGFFSGETIQKVEALVPPVVEAIIEATTALIKEGAAEVVVGGLLPLGCSTVFLTLFQSAKESDYDLLGCLTAFNAFSELHNSRLKASLEVPQKEYPHVKIVYMDYFSATMHFIRDPQCYGLNKETILMTCCGGGGPNNFNPAAWCGTNGSTTCQDPSLYANWDGLHLTEAAYRIIAGALLNASFTHPPAELL